MKNKKEDEELVKMTVRIPKYKKEMLANIVEKSSYNNLSELVRAGIDKEIDLQIYKDNLDFIIKEFDRLIDVKLDPFIKAQRNLTVKYLRTTAINTYLLGETFSRLLGDELNNEFVKILSNARKKADYFVNKDLSRMNEKDLYDFYYIGNVYRQE